MPAGQHNGPQHDNPGNGGNRDIVRAFSMLSQIGISIIVCIALGIAAGWFLDKWLGTSPWLLIVCTLSGVIAAFRSIFDFAKRQK